MMACGVTAPGCRKKFPTPIPGLPASPRAALPVVRSPSFFAGGWELHDGTERYADGQHAGRGDLLHDERDVADNVVVRVHEPDCRRDGKYNHRGNGGGERYYTERNRYSDVYRVPSGDSDADI